MRVEESNYWDGVADKVLPNLRDNVWKRQQIVRRILESDIAGHDVLEIGVGVPVVACVLRYILRDTFKYTCTDVSEKFVKFAMDVGLDAYHADVTRLPGERYTRIIALDSLEHVNPCDRLVGYREIHRVMAERCKIFINIPMSESHHDPSFDFQFGLDDVLELSKLTNTSLVRWEPYEINAVHPNGNKINLNYVWAELER